MSIENLSVFYYYQQAPGKPGVCSMYNNFSDVSQFTRLKCVSKEEILGTIQNMLEYTCRDLVSASYISQQISKNRIILILYDKTKTTAVETVGRSRSSAASTVAYKPMPMGFIMASLDDGEFYIDVICSAPGYGRYLLEFFMHDAIENKKARSIGLSALPHVLTYYPRFGFTHRRSCGEAGIGLPDNIKRRMAMKARLPATVDESYDDDDFAAFMEVLRDHGFGETAGDCQTKPLTKHALKTGACGQNGYYMKYCAPTKTRAQSSQASSQAS